jgi:hypothetical protein
MDVIEMRDAIEKLPKEYHIEIGRILHSNQVSMNENQNGIFVNMSTINEQVLNKIQHFVQYVELQEKQLHVDEAEKEGLKGTFFNENIKQAVKNKV